MMRSRRHQRMFGEKGGAKGFDQRMAELVENSDFTPDFVFANIEVIFSQIFKPKFVTLLTKTSQTLTKKPLMESHIPLPSFLTKSNGRVKNFFNHGQTLPASSLTFFQISAKNFLSDSKAFLTKFLAESQRLPKNCPIPLHAFEAAPLILSQKKYIAERGIANIVSHLKIFAILDSPSSTAGISLSNQSSTVFTIFFKRFHQNDNALSGLMIHLKNLVSNDSFSFIGEKRFLTQLNAALNPATILPQYLMQR